MSFSFGAPAANTNTSAFGGGFGTSQAPTATGFGQPAATGFGATSAPATGFGAATSAPAATTGFGATSTPFGTAGTTGGLFGNTSAAPATSTASTGFGGFGTTPATSTASTGFGGFGTAPTANNTTTTNTGFGGFGTTPATSTASVGFGGLGAASTATSAPSLFGAPATSTANTTTTGFGGFGTANKPGFNLTTTGTTTGGLFGNKPTTSLFGSMNTTAPATNNAFGGFGQQQNQAQNRQREQQVYQLLSQIDQEARAQNALSINNENYKPENVWHALALLKSWWDPKSPNCRFKHYFYNTVPAQEVHLYQRPADHDKAAWDAAQEANPDRTTMVPALAIGFDDVQKRMDQQHKLSEAHSAKLAQIQALLKEIQKKSQLETAVKLAEYKRRHMQAAQRVINLLKYAQVLRNKGLSITPDEEAMRARLEHIKEQLQRSEQFHGKLSQLWAQLQLIKESGRKYGKIDGVDEWESVSEENMRSITKILGEQENGIQHIIDVLETDTTEVDRIRKTWREQHH